jgi:uncharacterized protein YecT (DUF1311 family)
MAAPHLFASIVLGLATATPGSGGGAYPNTGNFGVPFSQDEDWYRQCMRVEQLAPAPATVKAPEGCHPTELYDRKRDQAQTSAAEWEQVRACALAKKDNAVLMMLYANGYGVARDTDRAIHHACILDFVAKAEMESRIAHLAERSKQDKPFDLCDDITSGHMGAVCAARREAQDSRVRNLRLDRAARALPSASRAAFARLREAAERYAAEAGAVETDGHGTAAAAFAYEDQARLREQAMQAMLDTIAGKLRPASAEDVAEWDRQLNAVYGEVMAIASTQDGHPDRIGDSTVEHADVRKAERLWLAYRDAFVAFRASLGPGSNDAIMALLTEQRVGQLRGVAAER